MVSTVVKYQEEVYGEYCGEFVYNGVLWSVRPEDFIWINGSEYIVDDMDWNLTNSDITLNVMLRKRISLL
jgi:phosphatidate phosphatase PAH1